MKNLKLNLFLFIAVVSLLVISCEKNADIASLSESISTDETIATVESENISDDINNVIDDYIVEETSGMSARPEGGPMKMLDCVVRTIVIQGKNKTVTLDFGEGCVLPNGNVLSGKIIMVHAIDMDVHSMTMSYSFENFYFNDISIEGENSIVRVRQNDNGNPQSTVTIDMKITWPDGVFASRKGVKVREFIEGYDTRTFGDNVFLITGNWNAVFKNGTEISAKIIEPLRREMACRFIVSGTVELHKGDRSGTLDYGDGTCDNTAIFTNAMGEETEIVLKGRMH